MFRHGLFALVGWSALMGVSCNQPSSIKLTQEQGQEQKTYKSFDKLKKNTSLIGESFTLQLENADGTSQLVHITVSRPKLSRIELTIDGKTFALEDGNIEKIIDVMRHEKGMALVGKTDVPLVTAQAVVEKAELQKALRDLRDTKPGTPPSLVVKAQVDFIGEKTVSFSAEQVEPK